MAVAFRRGWTDTPIETLARALELAKKGVALDDSIPQTHWALGYVYLMRKELENAEAAAMQSIAVAPNYADGYGLLALINNNLGNPEKAIELINRGMQLNPYYTWDYPYNLGRAYYTLGRYEDAISELEKARERNENAAPIKLYLIASYVRSGREARCRVGGAGASDGQSDRDDIAYREVNSDFRSGAQESILGRSSSGRVARVARRPRRRQGLAS